MRAITPRILKLNSTKPNILCDILQKCYSLYCSSVYIDHRMYKKVAVTTSTRTFTFFGYTSMTRNNTVTK